jgi:hypothetical protein
MQKCYQFKGQGQLAGANIHHFKCTGCGGKCDIQLARAKDGSVQARQVRLTGADHEYKPESFRLGSGQKVRIQPAYSVGGGSASQVPLGDLLPETQSTLDPRELRKRIQPIRYRR